MLVEKWVGSVSMNVVWMVKKEGKSINCWKTWEGKGEGKSRSTKMIHRGGRCVYWYVLFSRIGVCHSGGCVVRMSMVGGRSGRYNVDVYSRACQSLTLNCFHNFQALYATSEPVH